MKTRRDMSVAFVNVNVTVSTIPALRTGADKSIGQRFTSSMRAGYICTEINGYFTVTPSESRRTLTGICAI